jgi:hypothetical protein
VQSWPSPGAPNGRLFGFDLRGLDERSLLHDGGRAAIYALAADPQSYHPEREPIIFIHGLEGAPADLQPVVDRWRGSPRFQLHIVAYADYRRRTSLNGDDLADELRALAAHLGAGRDLTIVAHSMGGIVTRQALNKLEPSGLERFRRVRLIAVDTPWHGYPGPGDGVLMDFARLFLPAGMQDMRAASPMFAALYAPELPDNVEVQLVFAEAGDEVLDYTEGVLAQLADQLVGLYTNDQPVTGDLRLVNFWKALISATVYEPFEEGLRQLADAGRLDSAAVQAALLRDYPRFPGDHLGVLGEHPGQRSLLDFLDGVLAG